ncbi:hypothetical protein KY345_06095 [Candidatus Woesearchaeota archaeon]|nr:hypothetical protein [Candidatus Woesearchaeota archaeon]
MSEMTELSKIGCIILMAVFLYHGYYRNVMGINFAVFFGVLYIVITVQQIWWNMAYKKK